MLFRSNYMSGAAVLQTQGHLSPPTNLLYAEMGISSLQQVTRNPEGTEITGEPPEAFPGGGHRPSGPNPKPRRDGEPRRGKSLQRWGGPEQPQLPRQNEQVEEPRPRQEVTPGGPPTQRREPPGESCAPELPTGTGTSCICASVSVAKATQNAATGFATWLRFQ